MALLSLVRRLWGSETLEKKVNSLVSSIKQSGGDNPIVLFDTGAIIDFERLIESLWLKDKKADHSSFYGYLINTGFPLFVTPNIYGEIEMHRKNVTISGRPEISNITSLIVDSMLENHFNSCLNIDANQIDVDRLRMDAYWASYFAFHREEQGNGKQVKNFFKKAYSDPISVGDRELISQSLVLRAGLPIDKPNEYVPERPCTGVVILSPDRHIRDSVKVLTDSHPYVEEKFGYRGISVVSSREEWK